MRSAARNSTPILLSNPGSPIAEIYRTLRFNLACLAQERDLKLLAVTSSAREEGRTTTAVNLAIASAQAGSRVLLLDADLRNPAVNRIFPGAGSRGLSDYLARRAELGELIASTPIDNLAVMSAGTLPPNPSELLSSGRMKLLLAAFRPLYDLVVIDTPPLLALSDAQMMAAACDGVLLVVEHGKVKRETAAKLQATLSQIKADLVGVVLSKMNRQDAKAYMFTS